MATIKWKLAQWFELRWWKGYLKDKKKEEYLQWKKNYWKQIVQRLSDLNIDSSKTIADLGCGPAGIFIALPKNKVVAVDPLIDAYEKQTPFFIKGEYANTTFIQITIEAFESQETFDFVFCMNAINHVISIEKGFENLKNLCREKGVIIISIDAHNFSFFKFLFRAIPGDVLHPHQYDLEEYKNFLTTGGWQIMRCDLLKKEFFFGHYLLVGRHR